MNYYCIAPAPADLRAALPDPTIAPQTVGDTFVLNVQTRNEPGLRLDAGPSTTQVTFEGTPQGLSIPPLANGTDNTQQVQLTCASAGMKTIALTADSLNAVPEGPGEANNLAEYPVECRPASSICTAFNPENIRNAAFLALIATILVIVLVYLAGEFWQNPRLLMWSKAEIVQVLVSILLLVIIAWLLLVSCSVTPGEIIRIFFGGP